MLLAIVKLALRIKGNDFDLQLLDLIESAQMDLGIAGVITPEDYDAVTRTAIITYVRMNFGQPDEYEQLKRSYDEQKAQLATSTGHTDWLVE